MIDQTAQKLAEALSTLWLIQFGLNEDVANNNGKVDLVALRELADRLHQQLGEISTQNSHA